jgi:hypothetical protein
VVDGAFEGVERVEHYRVDEGQHLSAQQPGVAALPVNPVVAVGHTAPEHAAL